jgi:hypothetical protein
MFFIENLFIKIITVYISLQFSIRMYYEDGFPQNKIWSQKYSVHKFLHWTSSEITWTFIKIIISCIISQNLKIKLNKWHFYDEVLLFLKVYHLNRE